MTLREILRTQRDSFVARLNAIVTDYDEGRLTRADVTDRLTEASEQYTGEVFDFAWRIGLSTEEVTLEEGQGRIVTENVLDLSLEDFEHEDEDEDTDEDTP